MKWWSLGGSLLLSIKFQLIVRKPRDKMTRKKKTGPIPRLCRLWNQYYFKIRAINCKQKETVYRNTSSASCQGMSVYNVMSLLPQIELNNGVTEKQLNLQQIGMPSSCHLHDLSCRDLSSNLKWSHLNALTRTENGNQDEGGGVVKRASVRTHTHTPINCMQETICLSKTFHLD